MSIIRQLVHDIQRVQRFKSLSELAAMNDKSPDELHSMWMDEVAAFAKKYDVHDTTAFSVSMGDDRTIANLIEEQAFKLFNIKEGTIIDRVRGKLTFTSTELDVTDPCYDKDVWCRIRVPITPGTYNYEVRVVWEGDWGKRVKAIRLTKEEAGFTKITYGKQMEGEVGVDSGTAGFFENKPDYDSDRNDPNEQTEWAAIFDLQTKGDADENYPWITEGHKDNAAKCESIFTSSGYGDGGYFVKELLDKDKNWCGYELRFF